MAAIITPLPRVSQPVTNGVVMRTVEETMAQMSNPAHPWSFYDTFPVELAEYAVSQGEHLPSHLAWYFCEIGVSMDEEGIPSFTFMPYTQDFRPVWVSPNPLCSACAEEAIERLTHAADGFRWMTPESFTECTLCGVPIGQE